LKLSAQEEYGLRCLLQVAKCGVGDSVTIPEISHAEGLSVPNVAKMMRLLRLGGFVKSIRGQAGGFALATPARRISLAAVLNLLGGPFYGSAFCVNHSGEEKVCPRSSDCSIRPLWRKLQESLTDVLEQITLQDLLCDEDEMTRFVDYLPSAMPTRSEHY